MGEYLDEQLQFKRVFENTAVIAGHITTEMDWK